MATEDHIKLSSLIKSVHSNLREKSKTVGFQEAWNEHCKNDEILQEYSTAMKTLATSYWQKNFTENSKASCRVDWIYKYCLMYFVENEENELLRQRQRELEIAKKIDISVDTQFYQPKPVLRLLDVGSCYNPFSIYEIFDVLAIDIAPASPCVKKMDFIKLQISNLSEINSDNFPSCYFNIVVFSLFLEYIPCPDLRLKCCEKAYELLKPEGLLFIITPDSKHVGANAKLMKSWRFILAKIGFSRIKYEKLPHIHCIVFRKSIHQEIAQRWSDLHKSNNFFEKIFIPQDFLDEKTD